MDSQTAPQWREVDIALTGPNTANPYTDVGAQQRDVNGEYSIGYNDFVQQMKWTGTIDWIKPQ